MAVEVCVSGGSFAELQDNVVEAIDRLTSLHDDIAEAMEVQEQVLHDRAIRYYLRHGRFPG